MTPEERYERIDARIEAIAMHLELTAASNHAHSERLEQIEIATKKNEEAVERLEKNVERLGENVEKLVVVIGSLADIVKNHEHRIRDLDDGTKPN